MKLLFGIAFILSTCFVFQVDAQSSFLKRKAEALVNLTSNGVFSLVKNAGEFASDPSIFSRVMDGYRRIKSVLTNKAFNFTAKVYKTMYWPIEKLTGRNSIRLDGVRTSFKNTTWEYEYIDYAALGKVSPVKEQGSCGSCYAFGAIGSIESQYLIHGLGLHVFSEQQVIDCTYRKYRNEKGPLNLACTTGTAGFTMQYFNESKVESARDYPYRGMQGKCQSDKPKERNLNYAEVLVDNEDHLAYLLNKNGPLTVYIKVGPSFNFYSEGIFNDPLCHGKVNHAVVVTGIQKDEEGNEYWIIKNSWGKDWGENGFFRFPKGSNMCDMISNNVTIASLGEIILD